MRKAILAIAAILGVSVPTHAAAEWSTKIEGPDVFGKTTAKAMVMTLSEGVVVTCDTTGELEVAIIFRIREGDRISPAAAEMLFSADGGPPTKIDAVRGPWNLKYGSIKSAGTREDAIAALKTISASRNKLQSGIIVASEQIAITFAAGGSRAAIDKALKACKIDAGPAPAAPSANVKRSS